MGAFIESFLYRCILMQFLTVYFSSAGIRDGDANRAFTLELGVVTNTDVFLTFDWSWKDGIYEHIREKFRFFAFDCRDFYNLLNLFDSVRTQLFV